MTGSLPSIKLITALLLVSIVVLLAAQEGALAQAKGGRRRTVTSRPKPERVEVPESELEGEKVPVPKKYVDHCAPPFFFCPDAGEIFTTLLENNDTFSKGKFEKTAEWEARRRTLLENIPLAEDLNMGSEMTFLYVQGTDAPESKEPVYDADHEQWSFGLHFHPGSDSTTCLPIVSRKTRGSFCLVVPVDLSDVTAALVDMPPAEAEKNEGSLQIALVGRVIVKDVYSHGFKVWGFYFDLREIICLNPNTGDYWRVKYVLAKPKPAEPPQ